MAATYEPIATITLGSAASSITFSSIAASWTDIQLVLVAQDSVSVSPALRFNSDTASNYSRTRLSGDGTSASSGNSTNATSMAMAGLGTIPVSPNWGLFTADIQSYAGSYYKSALMTANADTNGSGGVDRCVGTWRSTSAITSITIIGSTFAAGTTATLYGLKSA